MKSHKSKVNNRIKVLFIAGGFPLPGTPIRSVFNKRAADALSEYVDITVLSFRTWIPGRPLKKNSVFENKYRVITLFIPHNMYGSLKWFKFNFNLFYLFTTIFCSKLLKSIDIIHAADFNFYYLASKIKKRFGAKVILQGIGGDINQELPTLKELNILNDELKNFDGYAFNSKALELKLVNTFGDLTPRKVIYRGCDLEYYAPEKKDSSLVLNFLYLGGFPNYLNFEHGKNTKGGFDLLASWSIVESQLKKQNVRLSLGGPGTPSKELLRWKENLIHPELINIIGEIDPPNVKQVLADSDVLIVPSREEGMPNALMEACAMGLGVIGSNVGGIPELIENNITGLLFEAGNLNQLSERIQQLIKEPNMVAILGKNARSKMEHNFDSRNFANDYYNFYKEILQCN